MELAVIIVAIFVIAIFVGLWLFFKVIGSSSNLAGAAAMTSGLHLLGCGNMFRGLLFLIFFVVIVVYLLTR